MLPGLKKSQQDPVINYLTVVEGISCALTLLNCNLKKKTIIIIITSTYIVKSVHVTSGQ